MFNSLKYSKDLEAAGFSRQQAEATIDVFFKFKDYNFATKEEAKELKTELKAEIAEARTDVAGLKNEMRELRTEMSHGFKALEYKMTIKLGVMQVASVGLLAAIIKFF
jgi:hypothetical protein